MAKKKYPLQTVLELRQRQRDEAQEALADRLRDEEAARRELARREQLVAAIEAEIAAKECALYDPDAKGTLEIVTIERRRSELKFLAGERNKRRQEVVEQGRVVNAAVEAVAAAREALSAAAQELAAIEKHQEKWRAGIVAEERRQEELLLQEIVASRFASAAREEDAE